MMLWQRFLLWFLAILALIVADTWNTGTAALTRTFRFVFQLLGLVIAALAILGCLPSRAEGQALRFISDGLIATDCVVTAKAVTLPNQVENNPLLGMHPTPARALAVCGAGLLANDVGVTWLVGKRDGQYIWALVALLEVVAVHHQLRQIGWRIPL